MRYLAQLTNPILPKELGSSPAEGGAVIGQLIGNITSLLFIFAFLLSFLYLFLGGIQWITGGADKGQLEGARNKITNALIGLLVVSAGYAVFTLVGQFFGIDFLNLPIPSFGGTTTIK